MNNQKLIIIRGNSGSGKSTVAARLREEIDGKVAIVGLDNLRRTILMEEDSKNTDILGLIEQTTKYCLDKGYTTIVEGILSKQKYRDTLLRLIEYAQCEVGVFYLDISLEESKIRHASKPLAKEVHADKLDEWYLPKNHLDVDGEVVVKQSSTLEETVSLIKKSVRA